MSDLDLTEVERIKAASRHLRGTLAESLNDPLTGAIADPDTQVSKFHGIYQQDDRDIRSERTRQKLEPAYSFMIRARIPGGLLTTSQWLGMDRIATQHANRTIRLTTRQAIQFHGVIKRNLRETVADINRSTLDTIAACGDVNRNVMSPPLPALSSVHRQVQACAEALSEHLMPKTRAYHEIWLDGKKLDSSEREIEPIYGDTYLPRKFKAAFVIPPQNDVDVFAQDLGFITIIRDGKIAGFNVTVGGGMGMTHGETDTYPRLADVMGFIGPENLLAVAEAVVMTQRDYGDRSNRKHARLKYTIEDRGIDWFRGEVERRSSVKFSAAEKFAFVANGDVYGWLRDDVGAWHYGLFIENGRVGDFGERRLLSGLRAIAERHDTEFRLTPNQNLIVSKVADKAKAEIEALLIEYGIENSVHASRLRLNSMACVAFPTCGLAMAESERYLPALIDKLDAMLAGLGLADEPITIRMTGCPNGCARPYIAEIGLVGKGPGRYTVFLGAGFAGERLGAPVLDNANEAEVLETLQPLFTDFAAQRDEGEHFGDFLVRTGTVREVRAGRQIHER
ncbi:MAG: NADPH-dependent assimilatory sulfite reductase hemoprotein subunit [Gammaproteobacteria bacterium]|nr:NADPH-dependent assimilatory sulfite reductase hemoprotein subunit [Gammaproteobacteria bacterium]